ncbi:MAG: glycosyltransferase [Sphingobacteriales bacterium]|nr:glycosyltransferase [Sphingobacteriales bacterium]
MRILHITASYQPAFVYGGPIYSVAALCEALQTEDGSRESEVESPELGVGSKRAAGIKKESLMSDSISRSALQASLPEGEKKILVKVYTTLANGKEELPYQNGEMKLVDGVPVHYFKRITKDHSHFSPALLWHLWKTAKNYDIIHIHAWWNLVSMGAVLICLLKGIKPIVSPRGMLGDYTFSKGKTLFHHLIGKYLLRRCDFHATTLMEAEEIVKRIGRRKSEVRSQKSRIKSIEIVDLMENQLTVGSSELGVDCQQDQVRNTEKEIRSKKQELGVGSSESEVSSHESKIRKRNIKIFVVHNIVQVPQPLPQRGRIFDGTLKLIFLSRIHPKKGIELLLDALSEVEFPFSLSIVGEGEVDYVESLKLKVQSLDLSSKINWMGAVYGDEKFKLLSNHDILVLPSFNENFANVVIESITVGTPVLISDQVGLSTWVEKNNSGLIHQQNVTDLKEKLNYFYRHPIKEVSLNHNCNLIEKYDLMYHA